jgi:predicted dehydrogenase
MIDVLIVGGGSIGERHLRSFQQIGCQVGLCDTSAERRAQIAERYQVRHVFASLAEALAGVIEQRWTGIVICTPAHLHAEHAIQAAAATEALLIEKPLATRLADAEQLRTALAGKTVQVAYVLRHHPAVQYAHGRLRGGDIGELHEVTITAGQHFPSFRPAYRDIYYARHETGGGAVQDAATHLFDLVQCFAGELEWVFCDYAHQELPGVEVEDTVHLIGRANGGRAGGGRVMVSLALNQFMAPNETHMQLNGARGSLAIRFHEQRAGIFRHGDAAWEWTEPLVRERDDLFRGQARSFLAALRGEHLPVCSLDAGLSALKVNLAALRSGRERSVQPIC